MQGGLISLMARLYPYSYDGSKSESSNPAFKFCNEPVSLGMVNLKQNIFRKNIMITFLFIKSKTINC